MSSSETNVSLGKTLSWLLRHAATKEGLNISTEGYISIDQILNHKNFQGKYTFKDIQSVVDNNNKKRFDLRKNGDIWEIKAHQGHSLPVQNLELKPLFDVASFPNCIHGTYYKYLNSIKRQGLSRMKRNHIHFASDLPTNSKIISGARSNAEIFIYIDISAALSAGLKFYKSSNGVILSPGDTNGFIAPRYFQKICDIHGKLV